MKEITRLEPLSLTKITAILGILWAALAWLLDGIALSIFMGGEQTQALADLPSPFALSALVTGIIGGFLGGAISGYLGAIVYNFIAKKIGGVRVDMLE